MIPNLPAGGLPVGFRVTWDRIVPGLEAIPTSPLPLTDNLHNFGSATKRWAIVYAATAVAIGTNPAGAGVVRLPNNEHVIARNQANDGDISLIFLNTGDRIEFGTWLENSLSFRTSATVTASTTQAQGQQPLTGIINNVATVANANDVVTLYAASEGRPIFIKNNGANTLQIFPATGDAINGGAANASVTLAAGDAIMLFAIDATTWHTFGAA